jgi:uncharacterized membrane protein (DUF2068 family)
MSEKLSGLRTIALLEAAKGGLAFIVAIGLHTLTGQNLQLVAERLVTHLHLNPASHYPNVLITAAAQVSDDNVYFLAAGVILYTLIRFIEAYGLWHQKRWTEWFALISGAVYIPFEIREIIIYFNFLTVSALLVNLVVVAYLMHLMFKSPKPQC